jgi:hypothetical protein
VELQSSAALAQGIFELTHEPAPSHISPENTYCPHEVRAGATRHAPLPLQPAGLHTLFVPAGQTP